jgi:hypothetical protein
MKLVKSITIVANQVKKEVLFSDDSTAKIVIDYSNFISDSSTSFSVEIEFNLSIQSVRNHDYTWLDVTTNRIANEYSPKIIKLENGTFVQANINQGIWEIQSKNPKKLVWKFNPDFSKPITNYGENHIKEIYQAKQSINSNLNLGLLFSNSNAIELSRSKIPFSAVICFTDHCDFDTLENLKIQRTFFKEKNIKITKGFFLNHFSKRETNASFERNKEEIDKWRNDNHELCYHSLSQSIKKDKESFDDFYHFIPPYNDIPVWIDHGYQPYNLSLYKSAITEQKFEANLTEKNISILWNYIDSGTSTSGVINQLNPSQFTLENYKKAIQNFSFKTQMVQLFKNILFHHDNDEKRVRNYIDFRIALNKIIKKKQFSAVFSLIKNAIPIVMITLKTIFNWNAIKKQPYKVAKYSPIVFKHELHKKTFFIFQTIEMVDFKKGLSKNNIDTLIKESGICIAHTYFSVDLKHYSGKLITNQNVIDAEVSDNFSYLSNQIRENKIWNPTLSELVAHLQYFDEVEFDIDEKGMIAEKSNFNFQKRIVN